MKSLAKIFIVFGFILTAGHAYAITIRGFADPIGPESLGLQVPGSEDYQYSDVALRASLSPNLTPEDRGAILSELALRGNIQSGAVANHTSAVSDWRQQYVDAFYHRNGAVFNTGNLNPNTGLPSANGASGNVSINQQEKPLPSCDWTNWGCFLLRGVAWLMWWIVRLFSLLLMLANQIFNLAIDISVRQFKSYAGLQGVKTAWAIFRDLVNLSFIFVLLYVAIGTILQLNSVNGKNLLKNVIIAALLVNFSFFFTGIVIDASNLVANQFYSMAGGQNPTGVNGAPDITTSLIAGMEKSYYEDVLAWNNNDYDNTLRQFGSILTSYFGKIVLMLITTTILLAGAVMFFVRTIVLIFVLVLSPVAFLGFAVGGEGLGKLAKRWQGALTNQVIFAPVYLLLIFMTITLVNSGQIGAAANSGAVGSLVVFGIINGLMLGSLMIAKELGVAGAALGTKLGGGITGYGTKIFARTATGGIAGAARGLYGGGLKQVLTGKDAEGNKVGIGGRFRGLGSTLTTGVVSGVAGGARTGVKAGVEAVRTGGTVVKAVTTAVKRPDEALNEAISAGTGIKILGQTRDDEKERKKREKEEKEEVDRQKSKDNQDKAKKIAGQIKNGTIKEGTPEEEGAKKDLAQMAEKDVVELDPKTMATLAHLFSNTQVTAIMKKSDMTQKDKDEIETNRTVPFARELERATIGAISAGTFASSSAVQKTLRLMNPDRLGKFISNLDRSNPNYNDQLRVIAKNINKGWVNEMTKNGSLDFDVATRIELMI